MNATQLTTAFALTLTATLAAACDTRESAAKAAPDPAAAVARGNYLVTAGACHDCHTPLKMGPNGPERDQERLLSGHPQDLVVPPPPAMPEAWPYAFNTTMTAWSGAWGVSFTANLTPDDETGLGTWDAQTFIDTIRNGRHMGKGRKLLPPMPAEMIANYTDEDLAAIFAYLQSLPAVKNKVPAPMPPTPAS
jgi:mono/diheme cytochrome c family protein